MRPPSAASSSGNVPDTFVEEVANHALALILAANRRLVRMDRFVRDGRWRAGEDPWVAARPVARLSLLTLGLVGFGTIGRLVAERARPFGFRLLAADPYVAPHVAAGYGVTLVGPRRAAAGSRTSCRFTSC